MERPVFPEEFVRNHCPKVLDARHWRKVYNQEPDDEDDMAYAECAFVPRGMGLGCESCNRHLHCTPLYDYEKFYPAIKQFYKDAEAYYKWEEAQEKRMAQIASESGSGI